MQIAGKVATIGGLLPGVVRANGGEIDGIMFVQMLERLPAADQPAAHVGRRKVVAAVTLVRIGEKPGKNEDAHDQQDQAMA